VDISNQVSPFNIQECAYLIKSSYKSFPEGTVHIIGVDSEHSPENQHLALLIDGHYFITANNGVVGLITSEFRPEKVVEINLKNLKKSTFPELDVFVPIACHIARGGTLDVIGRPFEGLKEIKSFNPRITDNKNTLVGSVMYIDNYGNVVTNIHKSEFDKIALGRAYELRVRNKKITTIHQNYNDIINFSLEKK
jgi:S-adenosylmethionine hydrolase